MKFVCERCHTKYSIADEKVRGKVLKVRCKTCANVITVRETGATIDDLASAAPHEPAVAQSGSFDAGAEDGDTVVAPRPGRMAAGGGRAAALQGLPAAALFAPGIPVAAAAPAPAPRRTVPPPTAVSAPEMDWYLAIDGAQTGPFSRGRLIDKLLSAPQEADVHVWNAEFDGWKAPSDVAELRAEVSRRRRATPVPPPPAPQRRSTGARPALSVTGGASSSIGAAATSAPDGLMSVEAQVPASRAAVTGRKTSPGLQKNGAAAAAGLGGVGDLFGPAVGVTPPPADAALAGHVAGLADPLAMLTPAPVGVNADLPAAVAPAAAAKAAAAIAKVGKRGQVKLLLGALAVVLVLCGIVSIWMFKRPAVVVAVGEPASPKPVGTDFAGMAARLAQEESKSGAPEKAAGTPASAPVPATVPPPVEAKPPVARLEPAPRGPKGKGHRKASTGSTTPPRLGATAPGAFTAEQRDAANRFGNGAGRDVRIPSTGGGGARATPAQADISRVINNNRQGIQTCYQRALLRDNTLTHGKVTVRVSIGLSGKVKSVNLDAPAQFRALEPCIRDVMSRWAFPPSSEEYGTEFPVVLQGG
ncbi:MAG: AgmX/PglI C-terminal domain-containing protein [Myxococcales bacterium]